MFFNLNVNCMKLKVLVLFDGCGCVSKEAKALGHDVKALDILPLNHIDLPMNILDFKPELLGEWIPDVIWASPPCETFSIKTAVKGGGNLYWETEKRFGHVSFIKPRENFDIDKRLKYKDRITAKRELHTSLVDKTVDIINHYEKINPNLIWCIENPASGFMRYYLMKQKLGINENLTTYCKYGSPYRKETSIFSNIQLELGWCPKKSKKNPDHCHHTDSFAIRWDKNKQPEGTIVPKSYLERSNIPNKLCRDILIQVHGEFVIWN